MRPGGLAGFAGLAGAPSRRTLHLRTVTPSFLCLASSSSSSSSSADASSLARKLYEQKNAGALPRLLATGALGLALGAGFPTALADVLRNQTGDAAATLGLDIIGTAACFLFLQRDLRRRENQIDTITKELELGAFSVRVPRRVGGTKEIKISAFQGARRVVKSRSSKIWREQRFTANDLSQAESSSFPCPQTRQQGRGTTLSRRRAAREGSGVRCPLRRERLQRGSSQLLRGALLTSQ